MGGQVTSEQIELALGIARAALLNHAELVAEGELSRGEIYAQVRIELDALTCLLDDAPETEHEKIHALLDRYDTLLAALVN